MTSRMEELEARLTSQTGKLQQKEATEKPLGTKVPTTPLARIRRSLWSLFQVAAISLGVVTGYLALVPKVTVIETPPLNAHDPFSAQFILQNDGPLGINSVQIACRIGDMKSTLYSLKNVGLTNPQLFKSRIEVGERAAIPCSLDPTFGPVGPVSSADIAIQTVFRPDFTWWRSGAIYRFETMRNAEGKLLWFPQVISK